MTLTGTELAEVLARIRVGTAHHEAGHAVAAVLRGGEVLHVLVGDPTDDGLVDVERELVGRVRHRSAVWDRPFIAFAGPWAQWRIGTETGDSEDMDLYEWLECCAWDGGDDYPQMGYDTEHFWDRVDIWADELERFWPAIVAVAELAFAGEPVDTEVIDRVIASTLGDGW